MDMQQNVKSVVYKVISQSMKMIKGADDSPVNSQYDIFSNIGQILTSSLDPDEVFRRVMQVIGDFFAPQYWSLLLIEDDTERLKFEIVMGVDAEKLVAFSLEPGEGIAGWVCQNGVPLVIEDVRYDKRFSARVDELLGFTTRSVVCVPLLNGKNKIIVNLAEQGTSTSKIACLLGITRRRVNQIIAQNRSFNQN